MPIKKKPLVGKERVKEYQASERKRLDNPSRPYDTSARATRDAERVMDAYKTRKDSADFVKAVKRDNNVNADYDRKVNSENAKMLGYKPDLKGMAKRKASGEYYTDGEVGMSKKAFDRADSVKKAMSRKKK